MDLPHVKRAFKILQNEGPSELAKALIRFFLWEIDPQYHHRFKFFTWRNHLKNQINYDAPPSPYKTIKIQPNKVNYISGRGEGRLEKTGQIGLGKTKDGDWDINYRTRVEDSPIIRGIEQRFEEGMRWKDTEYYQYYLERYRKTKRHKKRGFEELQTYLEVRCRQYDQLFEDIKENGYKRAHRGSHFSPGHDQPVRDELEVLVTIDREGDIHFFEGNHRFGIARVLDIEIPVQVVYRHKQWQELRDSVYNNGLPSKDKKLQHHPDLQDICS